MRLDSFVRNARFFRFARFVGWITQSVANRPCLRVVDFQRRDFVSGVANVSDLEAVVTLAVSGDVAVFGLNPDERRRVQLTSDAPVEAGTLEAVGCKPLLFFGPAFGSRVLLLDPLVLFVVPDGYDAVGVVPVLPE